MTWDGCTRAVEAAEGSGPLLACGCRLSVHGDAAGSHERFQPRVEVRFDYEARLTGRPYQARVFKYGVLADYRHHETREQAEAWGQQRLAPT